MSEIREEQFAGSSVYCWRCRKPRITAAASSNFNHCTRVVPGRGFRKNSSTYSSNSRRTCSKSYTILVFITIIFNRCFLADAGVMKVAKSLDFERALESSKCAVREEVVNVRIIHPTLPSDAIYMPSCVVVNRCSGCCQSDALQCKPTSIYTTEVEISQQRFSPDSYDLITLEFTHHAACACKSPDDATPVCVQKDCKEGETWDPHDCTCVTTLELECLPVLCNKLEIWNDATCQCEPTCQPESCLPGEVWNSTSCSCVPTCPIERCPFGQRWSIRECQCVQKCPARACGRHQFWNPETCMCQCKPCHPTRLYHVRFNQNCQTCHCACKAEQRRRAACRRIGAAFDVKTCTCEHPGRRG